MRKTFEIPLDIPEVTIQHVETDRHGDFVITVKSTVEGTSCHKCGKKITKVYGEDREITLRHCKRSQGGKAVTFGRSRRVLAVGQ